MADEYRSGVVSSSTSLTRWYLGTANSPAQRGEGRVHSPSFLLGVRHLHTKLEGESWVWDECCGSKVSSWGAWMPEKNGDPWSMFPSGHLHASQEGERGVLTQQDLGVCAEY